MGLGSLISLKTPQEGFTKQKALMQDIREGYKTQGEKVFRLGKEQQEVFNSGIKNYCNFGGHGSGMGMEYLIIAEILKLSEFALII